MTAVQVQMHSCSMNSLDPEGMEEIPNLSSFFEKEAKKELEGSKRELTISSCTSSQLQQEDDDFVTSFDFRRPDPVSESKGQKKRARGGQSVDTVTDQPPHFDLISLTDRCDGDGELVDSVLDRFLSLCP